MPNFLPWGMADCLDLSGLERFTPDAVESGERRVAMAVDGNRSCLESGRTGAAAYFTAACMLKSSNNRRLIGKFALNESIWRCRMLQRDDDHHAMERSLGAVPSGEWWSVPYEQYAFYGVRIGESWRLRHTNRPGGRPLYHGMVQCSRLDCYRLMREFIACHIMGWHPGGPGTGIEGEMERLGDPDIECPEEWIIHDSAAPQNAGDEPPCVARCRAVLERGENLNHDSRKLIGMFHRNTDIDIAVDMFRGAPDFDERTTRYHIEHIRRGEYRIPGCRTVKRWGHCPGPCGAKHPALYRAGGK